MRRGLWIRIVVMASLLAMPASKLAAQSVADAIQQLLLDVEKLSQMRQILGQMYQEYTMLRNGYEKIKDYSQGTFNLHKAFLDGLLLVSPSVSSYRKIGEILSKEASLVKEYRNAIAQFRSVGLFTPEELDGFSSNFNRFLDKGQRGLDELGSVITDGVFRMSDADRISEIDRIGQDLDKQFRLLRSFTKAIFVQIVLRAQAGRDLGTMRRLYGLSP